MKHKRKWWEDYPFNNKTRNFLFSESDREEFSSPEEFKRLLLSTRDASPSVFGYNDWRSNNKPKIMCFREIGRLTYEHMCHVMSIKPRRIKGRIWSGWLEL